MTHETKRSPGATVSFCSARVCDSGLKGRFPKAQGAALGPGHPPNWFRGLKGRFQDVCCFGGRVRLSQVLTLLALLKPALQACGGVEGCRDQVLTHLASLKSALQAWCGSRRPGAGFGAWCAPPGTASVGSACPRLRFRPDGPVSESRGGKQLNLWVMTRAKAQTTAFIPRVRNAQATFLSAPPCVAPASIRFTVARLLLPDWRNAFI